MASRNAGKQFRMWMPQFPLTMVSARNATPKHPAFAIFRTDPKMTKHEIKEYLTKIYDLPVRKVNTMNYLGKEKREQSATKYLLLFDGLVTLTTNFSCLALSQANASE